MTNKSEKTILLVDDEVVIAMAEAKMLEKYGYEVITEYSGEKAVEVVESRDDIDLVLMDINLGQGMDGAETAKMILEKHDLPLVFLSCHTERDIVEKTEGITSYGYIVKNSGDVVINASIKMALMLYESRKKEKGKEEALWQWKNKLNAMMANITGVITIVDRNGRIGYTSPGIGKWFEWSSEELEGGRIWDNIHPDDAKSLQNTFDLLVQQKKSSKTVICRYLCKNGSYKWIELNANNMINDPAIGGVLLNFADITKRKKAEDKIRTLLKEKELLLKEVHHRVKNNMNTIQSLLLLQAESLEDDSSREVLQDAANRIKSMMVLYNKLYEPEDFQEVSVNKYLSSLIEDMMVNFSDRDIKVQTRFDDFQLDTKRLQTMGVIINELLTNIMKYAFEGVNDGLVVIFATIKENRIQFVIQDNGVGMPESIDFENSKGFGLTLVGVLTRQLGGTIDIDRNNGTRITLQFEK